LIASEVFEDTHPLLLRAYAAINGNFRKRRVKRVHDGSARHFIIGLGINTIHFLGKKNHEEREEQRNHVSVTNKPPFVVFKLWTLLLNGHFKSPDYLCSAP
jgi:hypothetical protein